MPIICPDFLSSRENFRLLCIAPLSPARNEYWYVFALWSKRITIDKVSLRTEEFAQRWWTKEFICSSFAKGRNSFIGGTICRVIIMIPKQTFKRGQKGIPKNVRKYKRHKWEVQIPVACICMKGYCSQHFARIFYTEDRELYRWALRNGHRNVINGLYQCQLCNKWYFCCFQRRVLWFRYIFI